MQPEVISRAEATARGLKRYFTGIPCKRGHVAERAVINASCFACASDIAKKSYQKDPNSRIARRMRNYEGNKDAERVKMREAYLKRKADNPDTNRLAYQAHRERRIAESREWAKANPERRRAQHVKRKAAKKNAVPAWYGEFDDFVMREAAGLCALRERMTGYAWQIDHMVPLQAREACGLHCAENIQVIPATVNNSKLNKMVLTEPGEWLAFL